MSAPPQSSPGGRLRPDLTRKLVFKTRDEAESAEASLVVYLEDLGYPVFGPRSQTA
jgi:hypothetical protein